MFSVFLVIALCLMTLYAIYTTCVAVHPQDFSFHVLGLSVILVPGIILGVSYGIFYLVQLAMLTSIMGL